MTTEATSETANRSRRPLLVLGGASLLVAAAGTAWLQAGAGADPMSTDVAASCAVAGTNNPVTVPMTVDDAVDPIAPGGVQTLTTTFGAQAQSYEVTIDKVVVTTPIPAQIATTDSVTFVGGNMDGSFAVDGSNLVVTFTGPQTSSQIEYPSVVVDQTVAGSPEGDAIEWQVWSSMVLDTNFGQVTCTPDDPSTVLNTTTISGDATPETTTTVPEPETTTTTTAPEAPEGSEVLAVDATVCLEVTGPAPAPLPEGCPVTIPPEDQGEDEGQDEGGTPTLPATPPTTLPSGTGLPVPPSTSPTEPGLPVAPPTVPGGQLPVPPSGGGGIDVQVGIDARIGVTA